MCVHENKDVPLTGFHGGGGTRRLGRSMTETMVDMCEIKGAFDNNIY